MELENDFQRRNDLLQHGLDNEHITDTSITHGHEATGCEKRFNVNELLQNPHMNNPNHQKSDDDKSQRDPRQNANNAKHTE